jgi:hypothetical protein
MTRQHPSVFLIVAADEPAIFFSSVAVAESYIEAIDVDNGVYPAAYGVTGELYRISVDHGRVLIRRAEESAPRPDELRRVLLRFLQSVDASTPSDDDLAALIRRCDPYLAG